MAAKKKRGGRVTPKGTKDPSAKKKGRRSDVPLPEAPPSGHLPERVRHEHGRGARPITHNRGNR